MIIRVKLKGEGKGDLKIINGDKKTEIFFNQDSPIIKFIEIDTEEAKVHEPTEQPEDAEGAKVQDPTEQPEDAEEAKEQEPTEQSKDAKEDKRTLQTLQDLAKKSNSFTSFVNLISDI